MNAYLSICDEVWIIIASYLDNIAYLIRWKIALSKKSSQFSYERKSFWLTLIEQFFHSQILDTNTCLSKIRLSTISDSADTAYLLKELFSKKKCSRSGCLRFFREFKNNHGACKYHPGKKNSSGFLSCCREKSFQTPGCKSGYHDGLFFNMVYCQRLPVDGNDIMGKINTSTITGSGSGRGSDVLDTKSVTSPTFLPRIIPIGGTNSATSREYNNNNHNHNHLSENKDMKDLLKLPALKT